MVKIKVLLLLIVIGLISSGCFKERIDLELEEEAREQVIITAWLSNLEVPQVVKVSKMQSYLGDKAPEGISNAEVTISNGQEKIVLTESKDGEYHLPEDWKVEVGLTYELEVKYNDNLYKASHYVYRCPEIYDLKTFKLNNLEDTDSVSIYQAAFSFDDFVGVGDAYYGVDYQQGRRDSIRFLDGEFTDDRFFDGETFDDVILTEDDRLYQIGDTAVIELHSIGEETSMYLQDVLDEIFRGGPFDAPPANVRTNISGGALGYFITSDARIAKYVIGE